MTTAVVTFVYNEAVNLPIWRHYYESNFEQRHLFVIDHSTSDGSTNFLGSINRIRIDREELDEYKRCVFMASFVRSLLTYYQTVVYTDCDELLVPDLTIYNNLRDYIDRGDFDYVAPVGLNVQQIISLESAIDLSKPLLAQRRFARFTSSMCKPLITRVPLVWAAGFHASDRPVRIDPNLFLLHLKWMDYDLSLKKQQQTREMKWAASSLAANHGAHARYDDERFIREGFLDPNNLATNPVHGVQPFEFSDEIALINAQVAYRDNIYWPPELHGKVVELPDHLRQAF